MRNQTQLQQPEGRQRLVRIAGAIANPTSAPALAEIISRRRQRQTTRTVSLTRLNSSSRSDSRNNARTAATSKYCGATILWMNRPATSLSDDEGDCEDSSNANDVGVRPCRASQTRLDLQTNNSRKEGSPDSRMGESSDDYEVGSDVSEVSSMENASAVAKGADAMVKMSLSRQTEIIDTSKLVEEGKVDTEYFEPPEIIEDQDHAMVDEYEKGFAYARRLRALLNMQFKEMDKGTIETNFLLVKAHDHPTQKMIDRWRNVDLGTTYNDQVRRQKLIDDFRANAVKKKSKKGEEPVPIYPDMIRFTVRFRKDNSEKRWTNYLAFRQKQKKMGGKSSGAAPKPNDKYIFAYQDIWSFSVVVFVKPTATVREIIDPVFARLGLERRADFTYTIGCFENDKRAGKAKIIGVPTLPEPLQIYQLAGELYKKNCTEIYVNDNRCEMFTIFPDYYMRGMVKDPKLDVDQGKKGKKGKKDKKKNDKAAEGKKNKSNAEFTTDDDASAATAQRTAAAAAADSAEAALRASPASQGTQQGSRAALLRQETAAFEDVASASGSAKPRGERQRQLIIGGETYSK